MKWKCSRNEIAIIILIIILVLLNIFKQPTQKDNKLEIIDTTYNYIILDSIKYNIEIKDSIIYNIKYEYETKYIEAENLNDSAAVELFKSLCTDNSLYGGDITR